MSVWIHLLNGIAVTLFGSILSVSFCTVFSVRNRRIFFCCMIATMLMQGWLYSFLNMETLQQIYPLTIHLPLALMLYMMEGKWSWSFVCVLMAYLCCQLRRWLGLMIIALASGGVMMQSAVELIVTLPLLLLLLRFVSPSIRALSKHPFKVQCQFGVIPALYYAFDYATTVYTDLLLTNHPVAVEFMPFVCCAAYLVFLLYHSSEDQKRNQMQQMQKSLDIQLKQSVKEISALRESQTMARQYRHDLRHHLQYISACIENGQGEQAQTYIDGICEEIDAQRVVQYCENETVNLILSAFAGRAKKDGIAMTVYGTIPEFIKVSNADLCVLLSNALENALHACQSLAAEGAACEIHVEFYMRGDKLFLQITNPCRNDARFDKGVPVSDRPGHGIGVQSICAIVQRYGGVCSFSLREGMFILRLSI